MIFNFKTFMLVLILGMSGPLTALAQQTDFNQKIDEADDAYQNAFFDLSLELINAIPKNELSNDQLIRIYFLKGSILMALGNQPEAEQNFQQILALNPDYELKGPVSPKIKKFFATEKERAKKIISFTLRDRVVVLQDAGTILELTTAITNLVVKLHVLLPNEAGLKDDHVFNMTQNSNGYITEIPLSFSPTLAKQPSLSYYLEVTTKSGADFKVGSLLEPKNISLVTAGVYNLGNNQSGVDPLSEPLPPDNSKKKKLGLGLGLGIGGAAIVAGVITAIVLTNRHDNTKSYGTLKLTVEAE